MNKQQARQYVRRLVCGYIEQLFHGEAHPLVYDDHSEKTVEGRRLSRADANRVCEAMQELTDQLGRSDGDDARLAVLEAWCPGTPLPPRVQPDGKPGSKWKGYEAWQKQQGRT